LLLVKGAPSDDVVSGGWHGLTSDLKGTFFAAVYSRVYLGVVLLLFRVEHHDWVWFFVGVEPRLDSKRNWVAAWHRSLRLTDASHIKLDLTIYL